MRNYYQLHNLALAPLPSSLWQESSYYERATWEVAYVTLNYNGNSIIHSLQIIQLIFSIRLTVLFLCYILDMVHRKRCHVCLSCTLWRTIINLICFTFVQKLKQERFLIENNGISEKGVIIIEILIIVAFLFGRFSKEWMKNHVILQMNILSSKKDNLYLTVVRIKFQSYNFPSLIFNFHRNNKTH